MIYNKNGEQVVINDKTFTIGGKVKANDQSEYCGLIGEVMYIYTGNDKDTDNEGDDIYVDFEVPDDEELRAKIMDRVFKFHCNEDEYESEEDKLLDFEAVIADVIMDESMLDIIE